MNDITLDLTYMPKGHTGHLVGSQAVVDFVKQVDSINTITNMLEFGFNTGWSSALFFELTKTKITSIEKVKIEESSKAVEILQEKFAGRHTIIWGDSVDVAKKITNSEILMPKFNFAFIDGGHFPDIVESDINLCKFLGIKHFIFDDPYHENIKPALDKFDFKLVCEQEYPLYRYKHLKGYFIKSKNLTRKSYLSHFIL